jgi:hypothetical protein
MYRSSTCTTENKNVPSGPLPASAKQATAGPTTAGRDATRLDCRSAEPSLGAAHRPPGRRRRASRSVPTPDSHRTRWLPQTAPPPGRGRPARTSAIQSWTISGAATMPKGARTVSPSVGMP